MDRTAILFDIHGNLPALDAVLKDAHRAGAVRFLLGGDYALFGAWPVETVARLRSLGDAATLIRGNGERWTAAPAEAPDDPVVQDAIAACSAELWENLVAELAQLPEQHVDGDLRLCHASPLSDERGFAPSAEDPAADLELLAGAAEPLVVFGHTHVQFGRRGPGGALLVNPGSVGMPFDGDPRAAYGLLGGSAGELELRRVAYDHEASARALLDRFGRTTWTETVARRISMASFAS